MTSVIAPIATLLLSTALLLMGNGLQGVLLPVRGGLENFTSLDLGILGGSYFLGFAVGCVKGPQLVRRVGHIRVFTAMVAIVSATALAHPLLLSPAVWWALRAVTGFCFAAIYMVIESWLNERSTVETRGTVFSIYTIINLTVITVGQMMLALGTPVDLKLFSIVSILVSVAAVPVALSRAAAPAPIQRVRIRPLRMYRISPVGFVGCLTVGFVNGAFWSLGPVFAQKYGTSITGVALFMSLTVMLGAVGQWPLGRASDSIDRRKVIVGACIGGVLAALGLIIVEDLGLPAIFASAAIYGFFVLPLYALSVAHTNDFVQPEDYVETSSTLLLLYAAGAIVGPVAASAAMAYMGAPGLFAFNAVCLAALAVFAVWRMARRHPSPGEPHTDFADSIRFAQTVGPVELLAEESGTAGDGDAAPEQDDLPPINAER
ncbi:MAG: MFS transporter [Alphaproteobacteria bacterium]|nr:MFS transporter [Alphaproteobacteria bacterium]